MIKVSEDKDEEAKKKYLDLVVKADVLGSLEAIIGSLEKMKHSEVGVRIIGKGLGNITEDDVSKAESNGVYVAGFKVNPTPSADLLMRDKNIPFTRYDVIYDLINWVKEQLTRMLVAEKIVTELGRIKVLAVFRTDKNAMTVGGRVETGKVFKDSLVRIQRGGLEVGIGKISQIKLGQQDLKEAVEGTECGLRFEGKVKIEVGDMIDVYKEETKEKTLGF
jgi:translation initiation factor IF-2